MAHTRGIEHLPRDALREILTRVAGSSGGADIARAFSVSKTFRTFVTDGDVLRAVSFEGLMQSLNGRYLLLTDVEGLVARCSRAGNLNADLVLAKVALVSASTLCNVKNPSGFYRVTENYTSGELDKAARLLNHLSAQNTDPSELLTLVRNFLCRAELRDLVNLGFHLKYFATWFLAHGNKSQYQQFFYAFAFLREPSPDSIADEYNQFCFMAHDIMKLCGVDEKLISPLLECFVELNDDVVYETMIERVDMAMAITSQKRKVASTRCNKKEMLWINETAFHNARTLKGYLENRVTHEAFIQRRRGLLVTSFDAFFNLQQGSE